jgi:hypothetical protein
MTTIAVAALLTAIAVKFQQVHGGWVPVVYFFGLPLTCAPSLLDRMLSRVGHLQFSKAFTVWLFLCTGLFPALMLVLATFGFESHYKSKGFHWIFYVWEGRAGMTLWPSYAIGLVSTACAIINPQGFGKYMFVLLQIGIAAIISWCYVIATLCMNFTEGEPVFAVVPFSVAVVQTMLCGILAQGYYFKTETWIYHWRSIIGATGLFLSGMILKFPIAFVTYRSLPDNPPSCFIVTAASRGHSNLVGSWIDPQTQFPVNQQLLQFRAFEDWLQARSPDTHASVRRLYNYIGPVIAKRIDSPLKADVVYCLLKPVEWLIRLIVIVSR